MRARPFAVVAGGGTGGHVVPALALAGALAEGRPEGAVELVGSRRGLDAELLAGAGLPVTLLPGRGIRRRGDLGSLWSNVVAVASLGAAVVLALAVVGRRRPAVVVAMGGYASVPVAVAAFLLGVPVVLVNVDARPGAANRLVGRFARAAAVAFPDTPLPRAVVTGVPVRAEVVAAARPTAEARRSARRALGVPEDRAVVGVVGGSLGARRLNEAAVELAGLWERRPDRALYHVVGRRDAPWAATARPAEEEPPPEGLWYRQVAFEDRMPLFYVAADVVVGRGGANTVAELATVGVPALLVPLPGAPGDHQGANARALADAGAALVVADEDCTGPRLAGELDPLLADPARLAAMAEAARTVGRPDALAAVRAVVEAHARGGARHAPGAEAPARRAS